MSIDEHNEHNLNEKPKYLSASEDAKDDNDDKDKPLECDNEENNISDDEVLIVDRNKEIADHNKQVSIAPGQEKHPAPWLIIENIDELCFPKIFGGYPFELKGTNISYSERAKSEIRRKDRRSCKPTRLLYMAKQKLERACMANINVCLRKLRKTENMTAKDMLNKDIVQDMIRYDAGFKVLNQIRSSPAYWETKKKHLMAMIRQLGTPTFFLTLSSAEKLWPELLQSLSKLADDKKLSVKEAFELSDNKKCELIKLDPVTCARYYDNKVRRLME